MFGIWNLIFVIYKTMAEKKTREKRQEDLSKKLGDLIMVTHNAYMEEIVHTVKRKGDYIVTVALETAEGSYVPEGSDLEWESPEGFGASHVMVVVQDRDDKKFVPYLEVTVRVY